MCIRGNQGLIEMLTPEADWGCRLPRLPGLPGLPRLPPAFFYGENAFNNIPVGGIKKKCSLIKFFNKKSCTIR